MKAGRRSLRISLLILSSSHRRGILAADEAKAFINASLFQPTSECRLRDAVSLGVKTDRFGIVERGEVDWGMDHTSSYTENGSDSVFSSRSVGLSVS